MNAIKQLEKVPGMLAQDKASALLVYKGLKPTALVIVEGDTFKDVHAPVRVATETIRSIETIFSELALKHTKTVEVMNAQGDSFVEVVRFFIAPDQSSANTLKLLFDDVSAHHAEIGRLLGYPETAVEAFLTPNMLDQEDVPESTQEVSRLNMHLLGHRLSKEHWRDEVQYLERCGEYIKSVSPLIYNEITKEE